MKYFEVELTETLLKTLVIKATNEEEAWSKASELYKEGTVILNENNFMYKEIKVVGLVEPADLDSTDEIY